MQNLQAFIVKRLGICIFELHQRHMTVHGLGLGIGGDLLPVLAVSLAIAVADGVALSHFVSLMFNWLVTFSLSFDA